MSTLLEMAYGFGEKRNDLLLRQLRALNLGVAQGGTARRRFVAASPPSPTVAQAKTAITNGYEFKWNVVAVKGVRGYNIFRAIVNNVNVAQVIDFVPQPFVGTGGRTRALKWQEHTTEVPFYWIQTVGLNGSFSVPTFIPLTGTAAPTPPPEGGGDTGSVDTGGGSGGGVGGGGGGSGDGQLFTF